MTMADVKDTLEGLPLMKRATPAQILLLLFAIGSIFVCGAGAAWWANETRNSIMAGIQRVDDKVGSLAQSQQWMRRSTVSKTELAKWVNQLDHMNRTAFPALSIPEAPEVPAQPATPQ